MKSNQTTEGTIDHTPTNRRRNRILMIVIICIVAIALAVILGVVYPRSATAKKKDAVSHAYRLEPGYTYVSAEKDHEDGKSCYEVKGYDAKGQEISLKIDKNGRLIEKETEAKEAEEHNVGPTKVSRTKALRIAQDKYPGYRFALDKAEKDDDSGKVIYEAEGINKNGKEVELEIDANSGSILSADTH
ncbi:MAG: PepSY domain-containing protein [Acutalibacteraceae bacterium]